jgi:PAS domain S-box-containing protein
VLPSDELLVPADLWRLRSLLEDRGDAIVALLGRDLSLQWATRAGASGIYGRDELDVRGADTRTFVHPEDRPSYERAFARALAGDTVTWDGRAGAADGSWQQVRVLLWRTQAGDRVISVALARP